MKLSWRGVGRKTVGCVVGLLLVELLLRLVGVTFPVFDDYDPDRAVRLRPGKHGWYRKEGAAYLEINSLGYRDVEHTPAKPADVYRIAFLGDSFVEARQVDIANTFWKLAESGLSGAPALGGRKVESMSFGIGGYGTAQELLTLEGSALAFAPDLVVLVFTSGNDLVNNSRALTRRMGGAGDEFRPFFEVHDGQLALDDSFRTWSWRFAMKRVLLSGVHYSRILEVANQVRRVVTVRKMHADATGSGNAVEAVEAGLSPSVFAPPADEDWTRAWDVTEALLARIDADVVRAGARFVVLVGTDPAQVDPDPAKRADFEKRMGVTDLFYPERRLREMGEKGGYAVISCAERLQAEATASHVYFHGFANMVLGGGHWNEDGHRLVAQVLVDELEQRDLIARAR